MGEPPSKTHPKHRNCHHIYPRSRVPIKWRAKLLGRWITISDVPIKSHNAFHALFGNRTPEEQVKFLRRMCNGNGVLSSSVYEYYKECFDEVFEGANSFWGMLRILKCWDLSEEKKIQYASRLALLKKVLNNRISGSISLKRFKM